MRLPHADEISALRVQIHEIHHAVPDLQRLESVLQAERILDDQFDGVAELDHPGPVLFITLVQHWPTLDAIPQEPILQALLLAREHLRGLAATHAHLQQNLSELLHKQRHIMMDPEWRACHDKILKIHAAQRLENAAITPIFGQIQRMQPLADVLPAQFVSIAQDLSDPNPSGVPALRAHGRIHTLTHTIRALIQGTGLEHKLSDLPAPPARPTATQDPRLQHAFQCLRDVQEGLGGALETLHREHDQIQANLHAYQAELRGITG